MIDWRPVFRETALMQVGDVGNQQALYQRLAIVSFDHDKVTRIGHIDSKIGKKRFFGSMPDGEETNIYLGEVCAARVVGNHRAKVFVLDDGRQWTIDQPRHHEEVLDEDGALVATIKHKTGTFFSPAKMTATVEFNFSGVEAVKFCRAPIYSPWTESRIARQILPTQWLENLFPRPRIFQRFERGVLGAPENVAFLGALVLRTCAYEMVTDRRSH